MSGKRSTEVFGVQVFPARSGAVTDKGEDEKRIGDLFKRFELSQRIFDNLVAVQLFIDQCLEELEKELGLWGNGLSVRERFKCEKTHLKPDPGVFPELPVNEAGTKVRRGGMVHCRERYSTVPAGAT
jgi:hypothetical protein